MAPQQPTHFPPFRGKARGKPRGRSLAPDALDALRQLLGDEREQPQRRQRDLLIEHLHAIQDALGHLPLTHLRALAAYMNLPMAEVYETATFYAHFDVVMEDETPPPALTIRVCDSLTCEMMGARDLLDGLKKKMSGKVRVVRAPCMGRCETAPVAEVGHNHVTGATVATVTATADGGDTHPVNPPYVDFDAYGADGG